MDTKVKHTNIKYLVKKGNKYVHDCSSNYDIAVSTLETILIDN